MENIESIRITALKFAMDTLAIRGVAYTQEDVLKIAKRFEEYILKGR